MIRQQSIISGEYLVFETIDQIRKGQYKLCIQKLNRMVFDPILAKGQPQFLQLQMQLCRRLLYCCNKILQKYFRKYTEKSHKIQPLLNRTIELSLNYIQFIEIYNHENNNNYDVSPMASPSPTIKKKQLFQELYGEQMSLTHKMQMFFSSEFVNNYAQKSNIWLKDQYCNCYILLFSTLLNTYRYHKFNRTSYAPFFLNTIVTLTDYAQAKDTKQTLLIGELNILIGNAYFELHEFNKAEQYYIKVIDQLLQSVKQIFDDIEKLKVNIDVKQVKVQLGKLISQMIISLELQCLLNQQIENYNRCLEISQISNYLNQILVYFQVCKELQSHQETKTQEIREQYKDHVNESMEICKLLSRIFDIQLKSSKPTNDSLQKLCQLSQSEEYQYKLFEKYNYAQNNKITFVKTKEIPQPQQEQNANYFVKNQSLKIFKIKHNNSQHSLEQPSTNYNDSQIQNSNNKNDQSSLSQIDTSNVSTIKKLIKVNTNHRQSFLSELIHLRNQGEKSNDQEGFIENEIEKNHRLQKELLFKISNKNAYKPLDQVVKAYINDNLTSHQKCQSLDEVKQNAKLICQAEAEVHKEVPITKSLLQARRMTCPQGVVVRDRKADMEFNKLLEFNVIEYFDFVQTNKEQALKNLKVQQETKQVRLAQQNLFSDNFIPKKKLNFIDNEEIKQMEEAQVIAEQAENLMKRTQDKRKSSQPRLTLMTFMTDKTLKSTQKIEQQPISSQQALDKARSTIIKVLAHNEKQKIEIDDQDQELKEAELPYKFKRSFSGSHKKKQEFKSILVKKEFSNLCQSTKNIREKDLLTNK